MYSQVLESHPPGLPSGAFVARDGSAPESVCFLSGHGTLLNHRLRDILALINLPAREGEKGRRSHETTARSRTVFRGHTGWVAAVGPLSPPWPRAQVGVSSAVTPPPPSGERGRALPRRRRSRPEGGGPGAKCECSSHSSWSFLLKGQKRSKFAECFEREKEDGDFSRN